MTLASNPSIIIADNNEFYRQVLGDFYRGLGYEVRVAADGLEALEMIQQRRPDLLLLDLIMPRLDGARLCSFLRSRPEHASLPIIILSGILADEIEGLDTIRADAYVAKMPLAEIGKTLEEVSIKLCSGVREPIPILSGFEKMYRREVVLELLQERKLAQETLDSLSEGIVEVSSQRRLLSCNRAFEEIVGLAAGEFLSHPVEEIFTASRPIIMSLFAEVENGAAMAATTIRHGDRELQMKLHKFAPKARDGENTGDATDTGPGSAVATAVALAARTTEKVRLGSMINSIGYTLLVEDITQRVSAEREREQLRGRLIHSEKMSAIGLFVSGAAHELNNPLTSVLGYAQLLAHKHQDPALRKDLEKIGLGAARCKTIVDNLMSFARAHRPSKIMLDFNMLLSEAVASCRDRLADQSVAVLLDLSADLPLSLADPEQINQAFLTVLDNAIKAMGDHASERRLTVASRVERGRILVEFHDTGPGIPGEILSKIFEPFFTTRTVGQGAGLGLSVAYGMVTSHAGRISARNRPEGGASVLLEFPILNKESVVALPAPEPPTGLPGGVRRRRILLVDDEEVVIDLLVDILQSERHQIETASNGRDGLRKIREGEFDLMILDLKMPDMTGQQVYEEIVRDHPAMRNRLIFVTADTVSEEVEQFLRKTGCICISKPFAIDSVLAGVREILGGAAAAGVA